MMTFLFSGSKLRMPFISILSTVLIFTPSENVSLIRGKEEVRNQAIERLGDASRLNPETTRVLRSSTLEKGGRGELYIGKDEESNRERSVCAGLEIGPV